MIETCHTAALDNCLSSCATAQKYGNNIANLGEPVQGIQTIQRLYVSYYYQYNYSNNSMIQNEGSLLLLPCSLLKN